MKITFPHMGNIYLPIKAMFDELGVEMVIPPKNSKRTLELGTKYAPESICLPLKINLGNYLESIEKGADTIVVVGSCGPCRYGYYAEVQKEIFKDLGIDVEFVVIEAPEGNVKEFYHKIGKIMNTRNIFKIAKSLKNAFQVLRKLNKFEELMLKIRAYEKNKGDVDRLYNLLIKNLESCYGSSEMKKHLNIGLDAIKQVPVERNRECLKVGIVGEIYVVLEDYVNLDIGKKLNEMGVEVHKSYSPSEWVLEHLLYKSIGRSNEKNIWKAAEPYMKTFIGGHARETIGNSILYRQKGYDGVIQVMPFGCMPEIVSMSILPKIQNEQNIPILTLMNDEMTGEAGYITRLEAYIDLLKNRRGKGKNEKVLSWH